MTPTTGRASSARNTPAVTLIALSLLLLVATLPSVAQPTPGLVAAYAFSEGSGTTVSDDSGNSFNGAILGATWTAGGRYGNALSFNGSSSYVDLGNPTGLQATGSMTWEAWVKAAADPSDDGQIISKSGDGTSAGWQLKTSRDTGPQTFAVKVTGNTGSAYRYSNTVRALNTWYHVAGVYDASAQTLDIYVNGVLDDGTLRGTIPAAQAPPNLNVNIGRRPAGYYFNGVIDEVRVYNRALSQTEIQSDMNTPLSGTAPPPDTIPPTVSITAPTSGATVSGITTLTATASDNVGVASVQFQLDGTNFGSSLVGPTFSMQWNWAGTSIGPHVVTAVASDFSGNATTSAGVPVTVSAPSPAQVGQWSAIMPWPMVAVHAMLLPSGDVLGWTDYTSNGGAQIWRRATNTFTDKTYNTVSLFCAGHAYMADGRLLITGGIVGLSDDMGPHNGTIFDPATETWSQGALMNLGRYYPTATTLPDGRILVQGGTTTCNSCIADMPEIYDPVRDTWTELAASAKMSFKYYPHSFVLPDGRVLVSSRDDGAMNSVVLDLNTQTWTQVDTHVFDGHSAAMYLPGKILKAGTATADNEGHPSFATAYTLDMTQPNPAWKTVASMAYPRSYLNLTLLPDGTVLATGGSTTTDKANFAAAVYAAELWSPSTQAWTTLASAQIPRLYHSTALLLPDATVLVAGGGRENGRSQPDPKDEPNAEIFSPPYLFKGPRPVISSAPSVIQYATNFSVTSPDATRVASISIIALGAVTHAFNENQRFVPLTFSGNGTSLTVTAPPNGNVAPPGPYMLFLVDTNGVPSTAAMVRLPAPGEDTQPPTAPTNLTATPSTGAVSLAWTASSDNVAVTAYSVYRSATSGFTPGASNKIGQSTAPSFTDTSFTTVGTYYYRVIAQDAAGNMSPASNEASAAVQLDTTAPTVALTAPLQNATVLGVTTITASASDDVAVVGVQFLLDGAPLGAEVTGPGPIYTFSWTTNSVPNGSHTLSARARDGAGNTGLAPNVPVTVANTAPASLLAAYSFSEGTGTSTSDNSGNGLNGAITGATWSTAGKYGNALSFNGTTNYVDLGNPAALQATGSMTWEAWVKAAANPSDDAQIITKSLDSPNGGWQLKTTPDTGVRTFGVKVTGSAGSAYRYSKTVLTLNSWYHVAGVYNATTQTLDIYVNGALDDGTLRGTIPSAQVLAGANLNIGRRPAGYYFNGLIDEVRIYSRALSAGEIQTDMNTPINGTAPPDTTPPTVSLTSPTGGAFVGGTFPITASATDNVAMGGVQFLLDGSPLGSEVPGPGPTYTFNWDTTAAANGPHVLSATARDAANNKANAANVSVTVTNGDLTPPTVSLTSPTGTSPLSGTVAVTASASDNVAMAGVQFLVDGANAGAEVTGLGPTYNFNWATTSVPNGTHILSARARDVSNNTALAPNVSVTVSNTAPTGLLASYSFNQGSGTTAPDGSGNNLTGAITGATWTTAGKYGSALSFNGSSNYVDLGNPAALQVTGSMTWAAWVKATGTPSDDGQIIAKSSDSVGGWQIKSSPDTGARTFAVKVTGSSGSAYRYSKTLVTLNTWYHVAGVYNAATQTLDIYINGVLDDGTLRGTIPSSQVLAGVNVNIGRKSTGYYFNGVIDEVQIYNRVLSAAEIQALMTTPLP